MKVDWKRYRLLTTHGVLACALGAVLATASAQAEDVLTYEPHKVIADEKGKCEQCHENAVLAWEESTHKKTFDELHLRDEAKAVLERMGSKGSIRRNAECVQCHYTQTATEPGGRAKTVMGVSCQRCHGGAVDWLDVHQDTEGIPDRAARKAKSASLGQRLTDDIYTLAMNCFQCHTVPKEDLVNKGQHPAGSEIELVAWSHGEVRHNFLNDDPKARAEQDSNNDTSAETKQVFYLVGKSLDLEFALRGLAKATADGNYLTAMGERAQSAYDALKALGGMDSVISQVPMDGGKVKVAAGNAGEYESAADGIRKVAKTIESDKGKFSAALGAAGSKVSSSYHGEVYE
jgi:hypothetical protein